ncbi:MAG: undecaprenyldiphospho-muramoylpentapeptide beta-N-acetylglucosaminyltransferase [Methylobacteriaceae bacterium]|nr:undecaprenyldiphospho-muramoylpentapeptide beta-N-acetylglucosaminyltransferase [Methylobacteriaceae bacterium]
MSEDRPVLLAAGGTGGHLFPAQALAVALAARGVPVELVTDERALKYGGEFPARAFHTIAAATPTGGSLISKALAVLKLMRGTIAARRLVARVRPRAVVGFGGYPTVPPMLAARQLKIPSILHEQNAVMGRANRFLSGAVDAIATGFPTLSGVAEAARGKLRHVGNPLRPAVLAAAAAPYPDDSSLCVVVTGGSQGARVMSDVAPAAIALLSAEQRARVKLTQQARGEDEARVREAYAKLGFAAEIAPFFADLPARMAGAHLVVARAGASTVSELAAIGRACVLVPFPHALDQDQAANARALEQAGAATVIPQSDFSPQRLAQDLVEALEDPATLKLRADAARAVAVLDAADRLADLVLEIAPSPSGVRSSS